MFAHYLIPLLSLLLAGANSVLYLVFFLCLKREVRGTNLRWQERQAAQESATEELRAQVAQLNARVRDAEERAGVLVPPTPPRSGLNLNKRTQVIRMSRRGEQADKIAASLQLPQREVELLLKVHSHEVYSAVEVNATAAAANAVNS